MKVHVAIENQEIQDFPKSSKPKFHQISLDLVKLHPIPKTNARGINQKSKKNNISKMTQICKQSNFIPSHVKPSRKEKKTKTPKHK